MRSAIQSKPARQFDYAVYIPWALMVLAIMVRLIPGERLIDDAYITFRYARNIVEGLGFAYNPGDHVLGTTTPLYTLLLALLAALGGTAHFPEIAIGLNALADGLTCALLVPLGIELSGKRRVGIGAGLLYALAPFSVTFAIGGMETSVYVLLLVATALLYLRGKNAWAATASLAFLTRPDALIFIGPIALDFAIRWMRAFIAARGPARTATWKNLALPLSLPLIILGPWLLFATLYFGSPIPHSITAKTAAYHLGPTEGFVRLLQQYATPFFEQNLFANGFIVFGVLVVYLILAFIASLTAFHRNSRAWAITVFPFLYFLTFSIANPLIFRWYLTPPLPFYILLILAGLSQVLEAITKPIQHPQIAPVLFSTVCLCFTGLTLRAWVLTPDHGPQRPAPDMAWFKLEQIYAQVGLQLKDKIQPGQVIAAGDIGALGYFSNAKILDTLGLVTATSTQYYPLPPDQLVINYAIPAKLITDQQPDYVVFLEVYGRRTLLTDPEFLATYTLKQKIATDIYGSDGMLIYQRNH